MHTEWSLTVGDALKRPLFRHADVVAGSRGLARPIRWVHVLETAENASFLNGGELILSTGMGFGDDPAKRLAYLHELIRRKAVGLCVELGTHIRDIPADMRELADHHDFPLIVFHLPVRFVDITLDLHERIVNRHTEALRRLEAYSRELQQLTLKVQGLARLLQHFQSFVHTQTFYLPLDGAPLFVPAMTQTVQTELAALLDEARKSGRLSEESGGLFAISEKKQFLYQPIVAMGHVLAYLGIVLYEREPDEFLLLTLDYTGTAIAQILLRQMFAEERALDSQTRLLDDILQDKITQEEQIRTLLGLKQGHKTPAYFCAIAEVVGLGVRQQADAELPAHDLFGVFRSILARFGFRSLMRSKGYRLYLLLIHSGRAQDAHEQAKKALAELKRTTQKALGPEADIRFGVSRLSERYAEAHRHFREAEQSLLFGADFSSPFFDDLGVYRLLLQVNDGYVLDSFIADYLGPLLACDEKTNSQLVRTLRALLDANGSKQDAAERLFIRRQTLYHRLEKIKELIGDPFASPDRRLCLEVALRAHDWLHRDPKQKQDA